MEINRSLTYVQRFLIINIPCSINKSLKEIESSIKRPSILYEYKYERVESTYNSSPNQTIHCTWYKKHTTVQITDNISTNMQIRGCIDL